MTCGGGKHFLTISALKLLRIGCIDVLMAWRKRLAHFMSVYRTAPSTPGLLNIGFAERDKFIKGGRSLPIILFDYVLKSMVDKEKGGSGS